ncbi:MAG: hypothetical protein LBI14_00730 [Treponema sp.]|nr:hypothetical protein [Treponema sp.]
MRYSSFSCSIISESFFSIISPLIPLTTRRNPI